MKKIFFSIAAACALSTSLMAQPPAANIWNGNWPNVIVILQVLLP